MAAGSAGIPTGNSTSSRCSGGACPTCICAGCGFGCRCVLGFVCSWLFSYPYFVPQTHAPRCPTLGTPTTSMDGGTDVKRQASLWVKLLPIHLHPRSVGCVRSNGGAGRLHF